jgi:hypothetical protein
VISGDSDPTGAIASVGERRGALLRSPEQCLEEVRQGLRGTAGALRAVRRSRSSHDAEQLVAHLYGLKCAAERLQASVRDDRRP